MIFEVGWVGSDELFLLHKMLMGVHDLEVGITTL